MRMANPNNQQPNNGGLMFPNQLNNLEPVGSSSSSSSPPNNGNTMLRNHLEQNNTGAQHQSKLAHQLGNLGNGGPTGGSLLLSQLAKQPTSDPNPNIINEVCLFCFFERRQM